MIISPRILLCILAVLATASAATAQTDWKLEISDARVTLDQPKISLKNLCAELTEATKVNLQADSRCADQLLSIRVRNQNLASLLRCLEVLIPGTWEKQSAPSTFKFVPNREALLRKQRWWNRFQSARSAATAQIQQIFVQEMRSRPSQRMIDSEEDPFWRQALQSGANNQRFWLNLTAIQQQMVAQSYDATDTYRRIYRSLRIRREGGLFLPWNELGEVAKSALVAAAQTNTRTQLNPDTFSGVQFNSTGTSISAKLIFKDGRVLDTSLDISLPYYALPPVFFVDHRFLPEIIVQLEKNPTTTSGRSTTKANIPRAWRDFETDQKSLFWPGDYGKETSLVIPEHWRSVVQRAADTYGFDYISDYYSLPYAEPSSNKSVSAKTPVKEHLDTICTQQDVSWKVSDEIILFRHNRWYRDDFLEAPTDKTIAFLRKHRPIFAVGFPLKSPVTKNMEYLDACVDLMQEFSLWQIANGLRYFVNEDEYARKDKRIEEDCQPLADLSDMVLMHNRTLQFYATLSPEQRASALSDGLSLQSLNTENIRLLIAASPGSAALLTKPATIRLVTESSLLRYVSEDVFINAYSGVARFRVKIQVSPITDAQ